MFEKLDQLIVSSKTGRPVLRIGFTAQLYYRGGEHRDTRHRVVDAMIAFVAAWPDAFKEFQKHMAKRMTKIADLEQVARIYHAEVDRLDPVYDGHGPNLDDGQLPPAWQLLATNQSGDDDRYDLSYLIAGMPATPAKSDPGALIERLATLCSGIRPVHGTAGLGPIYESGMWPHYPAETWPLLARFSGLDYPSPFALNASRVDEIRGVNWLTILGDPMLAHMGGLDGLRRILARAEDDLRGSAPTGRDDLGFDLYPYDGGVIVRAGRMPQLGDVNDAGKPWTYRVVNAALRPWRFSAYENSPVCLIKVPRPLDPYAETIRWITRFDEE